MFENEAERMGAGESKCRPLASLWRRRRRREYGSRRVLPYVKNRRSNLGLEVTILKQAETLPLKLCLEVLWAPLNKTVQTGGPGGTNVGALHTVLFFLLHRVFFLSYKLLEEMTPLCSYYPRNRHLLPFGTYSICSVVTFACFQRFGETWDDKTAWLGSNECWVKTGAGQLRTKRFKCKQTFEHLEYVPSWVTRHTGKRPRWSLSL